MEQTQNLGRKRAMSVISLLYFLLIAALAVLSFFYTVEVPQKAACCVVLIAISGGALAAMLYSRKQVLTKICSVRGMGSTRPLGRDGSAGIFPMWLHRND